MSLQSIVRKLTPRLKFPLGFHQGGKMNDVEGKVFSAADGDIKFSNSRSLKPLLLSGSKNVTFSEQPSENKVELFPYKISLCNSNDQKLSYVVPNMKLPIIRKIIEPENKINVRIEMPVKSIVNKEVDLPCNIEREMIDPVGHVISKKAVVMIRIRRKKMKKHRWRKFHKKMKYEFAKRRQKREMEKEIVFQNGLKEILKAGENFSAEQYIDKTLEKFNWTPPVTKVRGRLAPQSVINEYLKTKEEENLLYERIKECEKNFK